MSKEPPNYALRVFLIMFVCIVFTGAVCYYQGGKDAKATPCPAVSR